MSTPAPDPKPVPIRDLLPDYREQSPEVAARFARLRARPVILSLRDLEKSYGRGEGRTVVLNKIRFEVHRREFLCVVGPSGCGKSTLARIVAGLDEATGGEVLLDGQPAEGPGPDRGMVFQGYTLFPWLTVKGNVMFGLKMRGKSSRNAEKEAHEWLGLVGLDEFAESYPHELSGGMKQRVAIARGMAMEPDILFITHDLDEAAYLSDRILVMGAHPGRVVELIDNPVPRPRSREQFISRPFLSLKRRLNELIHARGEGEEIKLPLTLRPYVGESVE